jgi:hypothetical protein
MSLDCQPRIVNAKLYRSKHFFGCLICIALTGSAFGEDAPPTHRVKDAADAMLSCYNFAAIKYAVQTCKPAASIITAVYGRCDRLEKDFKHAVDLEHGDPVYSEAVLNELRKMDEPKLYALTAARLEREPSTTVGLSPASQEGPSPPPLRSPETAPTRNSVA